MIRCPPPTLVSLRGFVMSRYRPSKIEEREERLLLVHSAQATSHNSPRRPACCVKAWSYSSISSLPITAPSPFLHHSCPSPPCFRFSDKHATEQPLPRALLFYYSTFPRNRNRREFQFFIFNMLPREASKRVPIFDRGTGSKPARLGQAQIQLPTG